MNKIEYLLQCLQEECNEVAQAASKVNRFGLDNSWETETTNREFLIMELNDLFGVIQTLQVEKVLPVPLSDITKIRAKVDKIKWAMDYSRNKGVLHEN